jgi:hypothetical protein
VIDGLASLDLAYPTVDKRKRKELEERGKRWWSSPPAITRCRGNRRIAGGPARRIKGKRQVIAARYLLKRHYCRRPV